MSMTGGHGLEMNLAYALECLKQSATLGYHRAQTSVGKFYYFGHAPCSSKSEDMATARYWLLKAACSSDARAQTHLGIMLVSGEGGPVELLNGIALLEKAAAQNYAPAQANLDEIRGRMLLEPFAF